MTIETAAERVQASRVADAAAVTRDGRAWGRRIGGMAVVLGIGWSVAFVLVGVGFGLQMYGDGSIFSYSVAAEAGWAYHFHNIADRLFVYIFSHWPAEIYVALSHDARGGIVLYGTLFFAAPLAGVLLTAAADRSPGRIIFCAACLSTACLCPMVFGFPTEMWVAHALFWPALALCHYARRGIAGAAGVLAVLVALVLTHEGGVVFALAILCTVALRGWRDAAVLRAAGALLAALAVWGVVKWVFPPDRYYASIIPAAEMTFIDPRGLLASDYFVLLLAALAGYGVVLLALRRLAPAQAPALAFVIVALALAIYWLRFDHSLHTQNRYYVRTAIFFVTPVAGALAALRALHAEGRLRLPARWMTRWAEALAGAVASLGRGAGAQAAAGAVAVLVLAHVVETTKFVAVWTRYEAAVRTLATGVESDPALGDPRFVSSERIGADLNRMAWQTTTQFLSVLLAPGFLPARLVVDPTAGYFWLTCAQATASEKADVPMPAEGRRLIRVYSCLHRR